MKKEALNKSEIIDRILESWNEVDVNGKQINKVVNALLEQIEKALVAGEEINFIGYFSLFTTEQAERTAINFQTKEKMIVPAKRVPKAKFSKGLKANIEEKK